MLRQPPGSRIGSISRNLWPRTVPVLDLQPEEATKLTARLPGAPRVSAVIPLPGGLTNSNFSLEFCDGRPAVEAKLYQHEKNLAPVERAIHGLGAARGLPVPKFLDGAGDNAVTHTPYALFEWIGGERLDLAIRDCAQAETGALAEKAGAALAAVHAVHFEMFGFFKADLTLTGPIDLGSAGMRRYFEDTLKQRLGRERLGAACADALLAFAEREGGLLDSWTGPPCLTHGDCGGTNILVAREASGWRVTGIIDWEFAFSGTPFFDLGNLMRAPLGGLPGFAQGIARGYREAGGSLPDHWQQLAAMTDLLAWVESATRAHVSAEFILSAQQAITKTIADWNKF